MPDCHGSPSLGAVLGASTEIAGRYGRKPRPERPSRRLNREGAAGGTLGRRRGWKPAIAYRRVTCSWRCPTYVGFLTGPASCGVFSHRCANRWLGGPFAFWTNSVRGMFVDKPGFVGSVVDGGTWWEPQSRGSVGLGPKKPRPVAGRLS
jgi:hypothetical protein